ncbi:MAG: serine/threonine protein kinase [Gemmatales bacterium]|nr:serine/threonine protein kinase [Gemmatales bacterium]MDW8387056.1 serine/threonine-protein kinase [Gemmatales bacterium]
MSEQTPKPQSNATDPAPADRDDAPTVISKTLHAPPSSRAAHAELIRGQRLAHFELIEPIGVGGMAAVIRARDTLLDRQVALKVLPPDTANEPENIKRFENEARAAARLDHENIARVYYFGRDQGLHFIAFEFVEGKNLKELIDEHGRIPLPQAVNYVLQIAQGLAHAADRGVVHRDIKPSNIIVRADGRAKLVDMGLARSTDVSPGEGLTQSGTTLGTFDYISPEQAIEPRQADCRSDIYSLGCTFYHMLTGVPPVPDGTAARKLQFHQSELPLDPRQINPEIPDALAAILSKMMAKNPQDRYQHPAELVEHLSAVAAHLGGNQATASVIAPVPLESILPRPPASRPWWTLAAGLAALVVIVGILGPVLETDLSPTLPPPPIPLGDSPRKEPEPPPAPTSNPSRNGTGLVARPLDPSLEADVVTVRTATELAQAIVPRRIRTVRLASGFYEFSGGRRQPDGSVIFSDGDFTLEGAGDQRPVIRLRSGLSDGPASTEAASPSIGFVIQSGVVTLRNIVFEIEGSRFSGSQILVQQLGGQVIFEDCEFRESSSGGSRVVLEVARKTQDSERAPSMFFKRCVMRGGDRLIALEDGANLSFEDCFCGPYSQPIRVAAQDRLPHRIRTNVNVQRCSWLLDSEAWLQVDSQQPCHIVVNRSVFSRAVGAGEVVWLLLGPGQVADCRLVSAQNYFHNLPALAAVRRNDGGRDLLAVQPTELARVSPAFQDMGSTADAVSPWEQPDPRKLLAEGDVLAAVRLNSQVAAVRPGNKEWLGPQTLLGRDVYRAPPTVETGVAQKTVGPRELTVDGQGNKPGSYKTLASALGDADAEQEIVVVLRLSGRLPVRTLDIGSRKITIRAAEGFWPELAFNPEQVPGGDGEALMFRLHDGEVNFENLALRLAPLREREATRSQALVAVSGTGKVRFKNCSVVLEEDAAPQASLVALADPTGSMMGGGNKPPRPGQPAVECENCFVRGAGELVFVRASRPFTLDLRNTLLALEGSMLIVEGNRPEASLPSDGASVLMDRVTAYLTDSLVHLRATTTLPVHVPVRVTSATSCVFVAALGNPLLRIDGPQSEEDLRRRFTWQGKRNFYGVSGPLLVWQPLQREEMPHKYGSERWGELWGRSDDQAGFGQGLRFANAPTPGQPFSQSRVTDFRIVGADSPNLDLVGRGAELELLPKPAVSLPLVP